MVAGVLPTTDCTVSDNEFRETSGFEIYPNPTNGHLIIKSEEKLERPDRSQLCWPDCI